jgi:ASC-1-like (ASCH) protein
MNITKHHINVQEPYAEFIKNNKKNIEGRLAKEKFVSIKSGDVLVINNTIEKTVMEVSIYHSFEEMIIMEGVKNVIPDARNLKEAVNAYYKFYSPEDEAAIGVCAIKMI